MKLTVKRGFRRVYLLYVAVVMAYYIIPFSSESPTRSAWTEWIPWEYMKRSHADELKEIEGRYSEIFRKIEEDEDDKEISRSSYIAATMVSFNRTLTEKALQHPGSYILFIPFYLVKYGLRLLALLLIPVAIAKAIEWLIQGFFDNKSTLVE